MNAKELFRALAQKNHPDKGGDENMMKRINAARGNLPALTILAIECGILEPEDLPPPPPPPPVREKYRRVFDGNLVQQHPGHGCARPPNTLEIFRMDVRDMSKNLFSPYFCSVENAPRNFIWLDGEVKKENANGGNYLVRIIGICEMGREVDRALTIETLLRAQAQELAEAVVRSQHAQHTQFHSNMENDFFNRTFGRGSGTGTG